MLLLIWQHSVMKTGFCFYTFLAYCVLKFFSKYLILELHRRFSWFRLFYADWRKKVDHALQELHLARVSDFDTPFLHFKPAEGSPPTSLLISELYSLIYFFLPLVSYFGISSLMNMYYVQRLVVF